MARTAVVVSSLDHSRHFSPYGVILAVNHLVLRAQSRRDRRQLSSLCKNYGTMQGQVLETSVQDEKGQLVPFGSIPWPVLLGQTQRVSHSRWNPF